MHDVAHLAGVSVATVSRALSNPKLVAPDTVDVVRDAVNKLNYVIQGVGRALVSRRTHMIGGLIPSVDHAMFAKTTSALQALLSQHGYMLALGCSDFDPTIELNIARRFIERGADGILLFGRRHDPQLFSLLEDYGVPYISTWAYDPGNLKTHIGFDYHQAAMLVVQHLVDLGHRDICIISGSESSEWQEDRLRSLKTELKRHDIPIDPERIVEGPISFETGRRGVQELAQKGMRETAIICGHDIIAVGAVAMCTELGINVPQQVSVTGFEDLDLAANVLPPLTTVRFPAELLGLRAGVEILKKIGNEPDVGQIELEIQLIPRGSTSVAPIAARRTQRRSVST